MKSKLVSPNTNHPPSVKKHDTEHDNIEHYLCAEFEPFLNSPEHEDTCTLCGDTDDEEIGEFEGVVLNHGVLKGSNDRYRCIEGVRENEEACCRRLLATD